MQEPRPPIMIGGRGEQVTLRPRLRTLTRSVAIRRLWPTASTCCASTACRSPDLSGYSSFTWLLIAPNQKELAAKKERHGDRFGLVGAPDEILGSLQRYAQAGSQHAPSHMPAAADIEPRRLLGVTVVRC
ncbi:MAG: hypothetical protein M3069_29425 [Chloroflexota bacterium]|nr:hypothetical protein [Chloroflexota bacterium]